MSGPADPIRARLFQIGFGRCGTTALPFAKSLALGAPPGQRRAAPESLKRGIRKLLCRRQCRGGAG